MKISKKLVAGIFTVGSLFATSYTAQATPFTNIRIGDVDGFGFTNTADLVRATPSPHTTPADTNGNGILQQTEFLPDLNKNGCVAYNCGDNFDNRSAAEKADTGVLGGSGFTDSGSSGFKWTDISLSTTFTGPDFPDPAGPGTPNEAVFVFDFHVAGADIVTGSTIFFNLIFGDYDVVPANVSLSFASSSRSIALTTSGGGMDGLIQAATATLNFADVFTADGLGGWDGFVRARFVAPNEPYTAFDFAELSLKEIPFVPVNSVPEPGMLALLSLGLLSSRIVRRAKSTRTGTA